MLNSFQKEFPYLWYGTIESMRDLLRDEWEMHIQEEGEDISWIEDLLPWQIEYELNACYDDDRHLVYNQDTHDIVHSLLAQYLEEYS